MRRCLSRHENIYFFILNLGAQRRMSLSSGLARLKQDEHAHSRCVNFMTTTGPYENADPSDRIMVGLSVQRRFDDGNFSTGLLNMHKHLSVLEAFTHAGLVNPALLQSKTASSSTAAYTGIGTSGSYPILAYNDLTLDKSVPFGASVGVATSTGNHIQATRVLTLQNNSHLVQQGSPMLSNSKNPAVLF